jgi:drug/metabolite transporter (DMT)-like permease
LTLNHTLQLLGMSALWGAGFMLTRHAAPLLGPNMLAATRIAFATLALALLMRALGARWPRRGWRAMVGGGLLGIAGPHLLFAWSALHLPAGYSALLYVTSVPFGALAAWWMKQEHMTGAKWLGCVLGFVGAALVVELGPLEPSLALVLAALGATVGAAMSGAVTALIKHAVASIDPLTLTAGMHAAALAVLAPLALFDLGAARFEPGAIAAAVVLGVAVSALNWWLYARVVRHVPPMAALSTTFMSMGFGVLFAVLLLGEEVGLGHWVGGALMVLASALVMGAQPGRWLAAVRQRR